MHQKKAISSSLNFTNNNKENKNPALKNKAPSMAKIPQMHEIAHSDLESAKTLCVMEWVKEFNRAMKEDR
jgi:hypothetical protein